MLTLEEIRAKNARLREAIIARQEEIRSDPERERRRIVEIAYSAALCSRRIEEGEAITANRLEQERYIG